MRWLLRKCPNCGRYTLSRDTCPVCNIPVIVPHPPRFSPEDKYLKYRLNMKRNAGVLNIDKQLFDP